MFTESIDTPSRGHYSVVQYLAPILPAKLLEHRDIDGRTAQEKAVKHDSIAT